MTEFIVPHSSIVGLDGRPIDIQITPNVSLKPCPFCGGEAKLEKDKRLGMYYVVCPKCKVETDVDMTVEKPVST